MNRKSASKIQEGQKANYINRQNDKMDWLGKGVEWLKKKRKKMWYSSLHLDVEATQNAKNDITKLICVN